jgi:hypothetical protein
MIAFTPNQWAILFLTLVLGWLLGMMSRSGGARWRRAAADERTARERIETERDAARARIAELERERPAVVTEKRVVTEEPVVTETAAERRADQAERRAERAEDKARAERAIVDGEDDIP